MKRNILFLVLLIGVFVLSGCARYEEYPAGTALDITDPGVVEIENVSVVATVDDGPEITDYIVGPGDGRLLLLEDRRQPRLQPVIQIEHGR